MSKGAPYNFVYTTVVVDDKKVKVYYLGEHGREKLLKAADKDYVNSELSQLRKLVWAFQEIIGRETIVAHFKNEFLKRLKTNAWRRSELVDTPFYFEKKEALNTLFEENKVVKTKTGGWIKLANPKEA